MTPRETWSRGFGKSGGIESACTVRNGSPLGRRIDTRNPLVISMRVCDWLSPDSRMNGSADGSLVN